MFTTRAIVFCHTGFGSTRDLILDPSLLRCLRVFLLSRQESLKGIVWTFFSNLK